MGVGQIGALIQIGFGYRSVDVQVVCIRHMGMRVPHRFVAMQMAVGS